MSGPYATVVVGSDGSPRACRAVRRAAFLADAMGTPLIAVTAYHRPEEAELGPPSERAKMPGESWTSTGYRGAAETAQDAAGFALEAAPGLSVSSTAIEGDPAEALIVCAAAADDALLVVGSQGMTSSSRFLLGSVPNKISHHAETDVLIVGTQDDSGPDRPARLLLCTDGSRTATRALEVGLSLATALEAEVTVLTAGPEGRGRRVLADAEATAGRAGVAIRTDLRSGHPADEIAAAAANHDLVVVGNRGMTGPGRFLLGSVPNKVSHHVLTDLLIVKTV